jgi:hypothetical protein
MHLKKRAPTHTLPINRRETVCGGFFISIALAAFIVPIRTCGCRYAFNQSSNASK